MESTNSLREQFFFSDDFQKKWEKYQKAFGKDLDEIFDGNHDKKIRLSVGLEYLLNNKLNDAYHEIRHFENLCVTEGDKQIFNRLLALCYNEEAMAQVKVGDWVKKSNRGYCQVIRRTPEYAIIKQGFDSELTYIKESVKSDCFGITLTDLKTYQLLECNELSTIRKFFSENPGEEKSFLKYTEKMLSFREKLLKSDFKEARHEFRQFNFYRYTTKAAVFILNLKDLGDYIQVTYGFTSIAEDEFFKNYGEDDENIKLRFSISIKNDLDEATAEDTIKKMFGLYRNSSKTEILDLRKEKQKHFLQKISDKLKPLGFKKKGTKWTRSLEDDFCLEFEAQKSQWSDEYYFNICVYNSKIQYPRCHGIRLSTNGKDIYNWQLLSDEEFNIFMDYAIENILLPIINTPLAELGTKKDIWIGCTCSRDKCQNCWVEKNLWEEKEKA